MWKGESVLVTGGASFIGSHLCDLLLRRGARVRVADNLTSGSFNHLAEALASRAFEFIEGDLCDANVANRAVKGVRIVFHLAAVHGGRGFIDLRQAVCARNFVLDGVVFEACRREAVDKIVYASSACVYPLALQADTTNIVNLRESMVGPPYEPDSLYGWAKLGGEQVLKALHRDTGLASVSCRLFSVYGERINESHAIGAMIARAFIGERPFRIWGDGTQVRNWTHVSDIVEGMTLAAERLGDASAVNFGTSDRITVAEAAEAILEESGVSKVEFEIVPSMPAGPRARVADATLALKSLGWKPQVGFRDGIRRTVAWYFKNKNRNEVRRELPRLLWREPMTSGGDRSS
jgi:nucleoside-diphosphate-sugar epimerase